MHKALFTLDRSSQITLQDQLREKVVSAILDGYYTPELPLPSTRQLAKDLRISRNTVTAVYQSLVEEGILLSRERSHYFINPKQNLRRAVSPGQSTIHIGPKPRWDVKILRGGPTVAVDSHLTARQGDLVCNFIAGEMDKSLFPLAAWRHCSRQTLAKAELENWPWGLSGEDDPMLIDYLRRVVLPLRGVRAEQNEILVTAGTQNTVFLLSSLFTDGRTTVGVEDPCHPEVRAAFAYSGSRVKPLMADESGVITGGQLSGCNYCYLRAAAQSPTSARFSAERRQDLLRWANEEDGIVFENDDAGEFNYRGEYMPAIKSHDTAERVIYFASFRSIIGSGIRLGYIAAPAEVIGQLENIRRRVMRHLPGNNQRTAAWFIAGGHYVSTVMRINTAYKARWEIMWEALQKHLPEAITFQPPGGETYWLRFPESTDMQLFTKRCLDKGIFFTSPTVPWFHDESGKNHIRLAFTTIPEDRIEAGIKGIAATFRELS